MNILHLRLRSHYQKAIGYQLGIYSCVVIAPLQKDGVPTAKEGEQETDLQDSTPVSSQIYS